MPGHRSRNRGGLGAGHRQGPHQNQQDKDVTHGYSRLGGSNLFSL
jgi:hypothetical protein